jgi:hypothetical protein
MNNTELKVNKNFAVIKKMTELYCDLFKHDGFYIIAYI